MRRRNASLICLIRNILLLRLCHELNEFLSTRYANSVCSCHIILSEPTLYRVTLVGFNTQFDYDQSQLE